ncbi:MAG: hypothetical protein ABIH23_03025 [bacterium]
MHIFTAITSAKISEIIEHAQRRVAYAAPGIHNAISDTLIRLVSSGPRVDVQVILDPDPEVCRIGYGDIQSVEKLLQHGIPIQKAPGLRIGVLVVDDEGWIFSSSPLAIEKDREKSEPNAIQVSADHAETLIQAIAPSLVSENAIRTRPPEIGQEPVNKQDLARSVRDLRERPPQKFDLARCVRVYQSYVQFVDMSLTGCDINRHTVSIPPKLLRLQGAEEVQDRLRTSFNLIQEQSEISPKELQKHERELRKAYLRSLGERVGVVILRSKKEEFVRKVELLRKELAEFAEKVKKDLQSELDKSKEMLVNTFLPLVMENPPVDLAGQIATEKPDEKTARQYLEQEFSEMMPFASEFISEMKLDCNFKDVTYEMLTDDDFQKALKEKFKFVDWPKPFEEEDAIKQARMF